MNSNFIPSSLTKLGLISLAATSFSVFSHEAPLHEHTELVPIPAFDTSIEANAENSLTALNNLRASLSSEHMAQISFDLSADERHQWSNLPANRNPRPGVSFGEMSDEQRGLLFEFLAVSLGAQGYQSVAEVMAAEAFLASDSRSRRMSWAPENYWLSVYGEPSNTGRWAWAFGGHHLAVNISIDMGKVVSMSPYFVGAEPAQFTLNGIDYDAIADMHEAGYNIYQSLDSSQKAIAGLSSIPRRTAVGANQDGVIPNIQGISLKEMNADQQAMVLEAAKLWISQQPEENSVPSIEEVASELDQTFFAWIGDIGVTSPVYYRIQGPSVIIELLGERTVGSSAQGLGHYHTVYRDPTHDYGEAP